MRKPIPNRRLILILLTLSLLAVAALLLRPKGVTQVEIYADGQLWQRLPLAEGRTLSLGEGNTIRLEPGRVRMLAADCPDQLCVRQGWVSTSGRPIVCLPNRVTILPLGGDVTVDGVTG